MNETLQCFGSCGYSVVSSQSGGLVFWYSKQTDVVCYAQQGDGHVSGYRTLITNQSRSRETFS